MIGSPHFLRSPRLWQIALAAYWLAIFVATHVPRVAPLEPPAGGDKVAHFVAYAGLAAILSTTWYFSAGQLTMRHLIAAWAVIVIYGALDELTQIPVGRDASVADWLADATGALVALLIFARLQSRLA